VCGISLEASGGNPHVVEFPGPAFAPGTDRWLYPGVYAFSFVRNPWDRLVSCYRDKIAGETDGFTSFSIRPGVADCLARFDAFNANMSFDAFVSAVAGIPDSDADAHFRSQHTFLTTSADNLGIDFVGRYENLGADFERVCRRIGLPQAYELPHLQAARNRAAYVDYYTPRSRRLVADRFSEDVERFGYSFGL
jgi:chondroitin 4-sulfotransferase 11